MKKLLLVAIMLCVVMACSPKVGSEKWCANLKEKPGEEWTIKEANNYAKHCIFKLESK